MHEELLADADSTIPTPVTRLSVAQLEQRWQSTAPILALLSSAMEDRLPRTESIRKLLQVLVAEYRPADGGEVPPGRR